MLDGPRQPDVEGGSAHEVRGDAELTGHVGDLCQRQAVGPPLTGVLQLQRPGDDPLGVGTVEPDGIARPSGPGGRHDRQVAADISGCCGRRVGDGRGRGVLDGLARLGPFVHLVVPLLLSISCRRRR